ncbi:EG45-like domain containing protein [Cryptomeria japonica]|uniref:EG45-like domain containing protein n=1 Tax=Cryptomeria japonica TaxID=3369 RepID=UPI0027DA3981|nr:EG45-like domain containing protein [Cryptomeria japonica]
MASGNMFSLWRAVFVMSFMCSWYCYMGASGKATFYTPPYVPSACYGNDPKQFPAGNLFAVASDAFWDNGGVCGNHYQTTCIGPANNGDASPCRGRPIVVKIVDYCPSGCVGTIDLSQDAFADIADPDAGIVHINYERV